MQATRHVAFTFEESRKPDMQGGRASPSCMPHLFLSTTNICAVCFKISTRDPSPSHSARLRTIVRLNRRSFDHWLPRERSCIDKKRNASLRPFNKTLFARPETRRIFIEISSFSETMNKKEKKKRNESREAITLELVVKARQIRATRC